MKANRILLVAALGGMLLGGCTRDGGFRETPDGDAVNFTAGIAAATRTTGGGDAWVDGDAVGIYMLANDGDITATADVLADNVQYNVADAQTGALSPDGTPIYYPLSGTVDFIACYPHVSTVTAGEYNISVSDQTDPAALDVLYAKTTAMSKADPAVRLEFGHVLSKVTLGVTLGEGLTSLTGDDITQVLFSGLPRDGRLLLQEGMLVQEAINDFSALKTAEVSGGAAATFTALLFPQPDGGTGRTAVFTVDGTEYTWTIPDTETFAAGNHYTYPVTVKRTGIVVGDPAITPWTTRDNGTGTAEQFKGKIVAESNSYMVGPNSLPILIPVSQANKAADPDYNLGADATGLGGVEAGNFTVELLWGDLPVGTDGVLTEIRAEEIDGKGYVYVKSGVAGNAVVAIRDMDSGTIKWSWHIWVTEPVGQGTDTETGLTWMDRNLGATANTPLINGDFDQAQWVKTLGLFYQWGRKDAFPGSDGTNNNQIYYIGDATTGTTENPPTGGYTELPGMVQNPLNFATNSATYLGSLNVKGEDNDSWGGVSGAKTLYDPCPAGWRVPPISVSGANSWGVNDDSTWLSVWNYGRVFDGVNGAAMLNHFYPAPGYRNSAAGVPSDVGTNGSYWSATLTSTNANILYFYSDGVSQSAYAYMAAGFSVRCVAEISDTPKPATVVAEANSYMVEPDSAPILIPVSQANRVLTADGLDATTTGLGGVTADNFTVELVWSDLPVGAGGVIEEIRADGEYVYVKPGVAGNAVVAIRDMDSGTIKWSWHIWVTEPVTSATDTETGLTWMDRNLGATANTPLINGDFDQAQWVKTLGLFYQWGRKDAFPGSDGTNNNQIYYIGDATTGTTAALSKGSYTELPDMVQNPLTFVTNRDTYPGSLSVSIGNRSWSGNNGEKTLYDPCPQGWKVPPFMYNAMNSWGVDNDSTWPADWNNGRVFDGVNGAAMLNHFYPAPGYRNSNSGLPGSVGSSGYYWAADSHSNTNGRYLLFGNGLVNPNNGIARSYGFAVRCIRQ